MKILVVSTYRTDTRNIGDYLITKSTNEMIRRIYGNSCEIVSVFRMDDWMKVKEVLKNVCHIFFACFALRKDIPKYYSFARNIIDCGVPYSIVSAGTALPVYSDKIADFSNQVTDDDRIFLKDFSKNSHFFSVRDVLSFHFFKSIGVEDVVYTGDVAFLSGHEKIEFNKNLDKRSVRIGISDPHYASAYKTSFSVLVKGLRQIFPECEIIMFQHSVNDDANIIAKENEVKCFEIWKDRDKGLDSYEMVDLHVGYRVHGHVSALCRGLYSYLLEQDGRGCGYGLSLNRKITVSHFRPHTIEGGCQSAAIEVITLLAMINSDLDDNFSKFWGIEKQIYEIRENNYKLISNVGWVL